MAFKAGLSLSFSSMFSGYLEPGGSNTNTGLTGFYADEEVVVVIIGFLGANGIGMGF